MRAPLLTGILATVTVACTTPSNTIHASAEPAEALPFIENDYPRALGLGRDKGLPVFVDVWAPW